MNLRASYSSSSTAAARQRSIQTERWRDGKIERLGDRDEHGSKTVQLKQCGLQLKQCNSNPVSYTHVSGTAAP